MEDKSVLVCALESTGLSIQEEMGLKGIDPGDMPAQLVDVRSRWEGLRKDIKARLEEIAVSAESFKAFLGRMTTFTNWLDEFHGKLYDEVCVRIPAKPTNELISLHKNKLEVLRAEVTTHSAKYEELTAASAEWAEHLIPDSVTSDLPSPSESGPDGEADA